LNPEKYNHPPDRVDHSNIENGKTDIRAKERKPCGILNPSKKRLLNLQNQGACKSGYRFKQQQAALQSKGSTIQR